MKIQRCIEERLREALAPVLLEVRNESSMHNVPPGSESHFRIRVVSRAFEGRGRVERHRAIYRALAAEMQGPVHALGLEALTPEEWEALSGSMPDSPPCLGGDGTVGR